MTKSVLKRHEFTDHIAFDFVKILNATPLPLEKEELDLAEDHAFEAQMYERRQELERKFKEEEQALHDTLEKDRIDRLEAIQKESQILLENMKKQLEDREKEATDKISLLLEEAQKEREMILEGTHKEKERLIEEGESRVEELQEEAHAEGFEEGYEDAYKKGEEHLNQLFGNIQKIADHLLARRQQILRDSQGQLTAVLLSAVRKIVYKLTEKQEDLVIKTLQEAMLRVTSQSDIILRVNAQDFLLVEQWAPRLQERFDNLTSIKVFEDSTVDRGGCLVETDFGEIDARIATQISRLEERILEINPVLSL